MSECSRDELVKKLANFHIVFVIDNELSVSYLKPVNLEDLGEMGCALSENFTSGIGWVRHGNKYMYDVLEKELDELKKLHIHYTISSRLEKFKEWVEKYDS